MTHRLAIPLVVAVLVVLALALVAAMVLHAGPFHAIEGFFVKRGGPIRLANMKSIHPLR